MQNPLSFFHRLSSRKSESSFFGPPYTPKWHTNVYWMLIFRFVAGAAYITRSASIFDNYIHLQFGNNTTVGLISSGNAVGLLITAPIAAVLSDRFRKKRSKILKLCGIYGLFCMVINYAGLAWDSLPLLFMSSVNWTIWYQSVHVVTESLFTESLLPEQRSQAFVYHRMFSALARGVGPLVTLSLFKWSGNKWDLNVVHFVLEVFTLWNWKDIDEKMLADEEETKKKTLNASWLGIPLRSLPWIIYISHNITFLGAGMTVKYFPLFFVEEYGFQPIHTCLLASSYTISIAVTTYVVYWLSQHIGRVRAAFISTVLGTIFLFAFAKSTYFPLVILLYLLRGGLQNAASPLNHCLIMEIASAENRGKWVALESLSNVAWSASALFGGMIADVKDYRYCFVFTGFFYIIGNVVYLPCLWLGQLYETNRKVYLANEGNCFTENLDQKKK